MINSKKVQLKISIGTNYINNLTKHKQVDCVIIVANSQTYVPMVVIQGITWFVNGWIDPKMLNFCF